VAQNFTVETKLIHPCFILYFRGKVPGTHWIGGWMGPRAGLDAGEKRGISYPCRKPKPAFVYSFIHQWLYNRLLDHGLFISFVIFFTQTVGPLGRVISPSQGRYLHRDQHKHRINAHTDIHALSGIQTTISVFEGAKTVHLTPRGHCDRPRLYVTYVNINIYDIGFIVH
jgi:hypothetical protein